VGLVMGFVGLCWGFTPTQVIKIFYLIVEFVKELITYPLDLYKRRSRMM
jgi:hypothetical protein